MRLLYINSTLVDIDEETSIGIDFQTFDIKDPSKRKVSISNTFSIPKTAHNLAAIGFPNNPQTTDLTIYNKITCDYYNNNYHLIKNGSVRLDKIDARINLYAASDRTLWDDLKLFTWVQFLPEYYTWLKNVKGFNFTQSNNTNLGTFLSTYINATDHIILPAYFGNRTDKEDSANIYLSTTRIIASAYLNTETKLGGHFCIYAKSIFEFLEYKYGVNFLTQETGIDGNIWEDTIAPTVYTPARKLFVIMLHENGLTNAYSGYQLVYKLYDTPPAVASYNYYPLNDVVDKEDKTLYDFVIAFMQKFCIMLDDYTMSDGTTAILMTRFDDIKTKAPVVDFSDRIQSIVSFKSMVEGYNQHNIIKVKGLYPEASELVGSKDIVSLNKNADVTGDLFSIDEYIANFKEISGGIAPDLSIQESFKTFQFFVTSETSLSITISVQYYDDVYHPAGETASATELLPIPAHYSLAGEYTLLEDMIEYPKVYEIKKWLTLNDIYNLRFFRQYYVRQLNGSYFINKISGFNPDKSKEPTTIELIKISDKTPTPTFDFDYWVDGFNNKFTDGFGNYFY